MTLINCGICESSFNSMREHCPICGARRIFIGSHSYEPLRTVIKARSGDDSSREIVKAYAHTVCVDEREQMLAPDTDN